MRHSRPSSASQQTPRCSHCNVDLLTNARSVPSPARGGGLQSHVASMLLSGVAFIVPVHPGSTPPPVGAAAAIAVLALRTNTDTLLPDITLYYNNLSAALTAQILTAVNASFLTSALEDSVFGFSNVAPRAVLTHLPSKYGTCLTPEELEKNRAALSEPWNLDNPIEDLWAKIANIQRIATFGNVLPIANITFITLLTLATMIEKTGLLASTTKTFCL